MKVTRKTATFMFELAIRRDVTLSEETKKQINSEGHQRIRDERKRVNTVITDLGDFLASDPNEEPTAIAP